MADTIIKCSYFTYNIHDFNSTKLSYVKLLLDLFNIVIIQLHRLNLFPGSSFNSKPVMDSLHMSWG